MVPRPLTFDAEERRPSEDEVAAFESRLGAALPSEYREFLLECNGGRPVDDLCVETPAAEALGGIVVDHFYSLGKGEDDVYDLDWNRRMEGPPSAFLPIADDPAGNLLALALVGADAGSVYFWDHETDELTRVATSFSALLDELTACADELPPHQVLSVQVDPDFWRELQERGEAPRDVPPPGSS